MVLKPNYPKLGKMEKTRSSSISHSERDTAPSPLAGVSPTSCHSTLNGLQDTLSDEKGYTDFMHHLAKEFSVDCLLSLTEFTQFRCYLMKRNSPNSGITKPTTMSPISSNSSRHSSHSPNSMTKRLSMRHSASPKSLSPKILTIEVDHDGKDDMGVRLPASIPQSWIVYGKNTGFDDRERAHLLWRKYIRVGAALEININSGDRMYYQQLLGDLVALNENESLTDQELMDVFIPCCRQMMVYLSAAFTRFESTPIYKRRLQRKSSHK